MFEDFTIITDKKQLTHSAYISLLAGGDCAHDDHQNSAIYLTINGFACFENIIEGVASDYSQTGHTVITADECDLIIERIKTLVDEIEHTKTADDIDDIALANQNIRTLSNLIKEQGVHFNNAKSEYIKFSKRLCAWLESKIKNNNNIHIHGL